MQALRLRALPTAFHRKNLTALMSSSGDSPNREGHCQAMTVGGGAGLGGARWGCVSQQRVRLDTCLSVVVNACVF